MCRNLKRRNRENGGKMMQILSQVCFFFFQSAMNPSFLSASNLKLSMPTKSSENCSQFQQVRVGTNIREFCKLSPINNVSLVHKFRLSSDIKYNEDVNTIEIIFTTLINTKRMILSAELPIW